MAVLRGACARAGAETDRAREPEGAAGGPDGNVPDHGDGCGGQAARNVPLESRRLRAAHGQSHRGYARRLAADARGRAGESAWARAMAHDERAPADGTRGRQPMVEDL